MKKKRGEKKNKKVNATYNFLAIASHKPGKMQSDLLLGDQMYNDKGQFVEGYRTWTPLEYYTTYIYIYTIIYENKMGQFPMVIARGRRREHLIYENKGGSFLWLQDADVGENT